MKSDIKNILYKHRNGMEQCSICGKKIPKDILRMSFSYEGYYPGLRYVRICGLCLIKLAKRVQDENAEEIQKWMEKLVVDEI